MGPSLRTWELASWARSRRLDGADEQQLRAVFEERDQLLEALETLTVDAEARASTFYVSPDQSVRAARRLITEVSP